MCLLTVQCTCQCARVYHVHVQDHCRANRPWCATECQARRYDLCAMYCLRLLNVLATVYVAHAYSRVDGLAAVAVTDSEYHTRYVRSRNHT